MQVEVMKVRFNNEKEFFSMVIGGDVCPCCNAGKVATRNYADVT